jgi:hypothetical protein
MQNNIEELITKLKDRKKYIQMWSELTPMISIDSVIGELEKIANKKTPSQIALEPLVNKIPYRVEQFASKTRQTIQ